MKTQTSEHMNLVRCWSLNDIRLNFSADPHTAVKSPDVSKRNTRQGRH